MKTGPLLRNPANARVMFDSRYKYLRVLRMINVLAGTGSVDHAIPLTSGYAVEICNNGLYTRVDGRPVGGGPSWMVNGAGYVVDVKTNAHGTVSVMLINTRLHISDGQSAPYPPTGRMGYNNLTGLILDMRNY